MLRDPLRCLGVHHILEKQQFLVEVIDRSALVGIVLALGHTFLMMFFRIVHRPARFSAVCECSPYPDRAYRIQPVRILNDHPFQCIRGDRILSLE